MSSEMGAEDLTPRARTRYRPAPGEPWPAQPTAKGSHGTTAGRLAVAVVVALPTLGFLLKGSVGGALCMAAVGAVLVAFVRPNARRRGWNR